MEHVNVPHDGGGAITMECAERGGAQGSTAMWKVIVNAHHFVETWVPMGRGDTRVLHGRPAHLDDGADEVNNEALMVRRMKMA